MKRCLLIFALLLAGCASYNYRHDVLDTQGRVTARYEITVWRNGMDVQATRVDAVLADGTQLHVAGPSSKPDPTLIGAAASVAQAAIDVSAWLLRPFGF